MQNLTFDDCFTKIENTYMIALLLFVTITLLVIIALKIRLKKEEDKKHNYSSILYVLLVWYHNLQNDIIHIKSLQNYLDDIDLHITKLRNIYDDEIHDEMIKAAVTKYVNNGHNYPDRQQLQFLTNPFDFDSKKFHYTKCAAIVATYKSYCEKEIANLKQKTEVLKRRQAFIRRFDEMILECEKYGYHTLISTLEAYKVQQEKALCNF